MDATVILVLISFALVVISISLVAFCIHTIRAICESFRIERIEIFKMSEQKQQVLVEEVESLVSAIARQGGMQVVFPRRGPLEPTEGWFEGKPTVSVFPITKDKS